ncbi:hypothetical protein I6N96_09025 [Enterococcus sp. BWM-S5]|uniref:Uncharacterized protein n=1 Tax=Enterococcus larvae TaxID=2794352 RepID=A0ABS4CIH1_9ENTE|nr:hypothetical protein [Enterococcus larvae]MBP1046425.1 hypothetical protein [Enterococcus larvae]
MEMKDITMSELGALKSALHFTSAGKLKQNEKQVQGTSAVWDDLAKKGLAKEVDRFETRVYEVSDEAINLLTKNYFS